ncbi:hypothetical protein JET76_01030 [Pseudomonas putida]|uniref:DUF2946 domain-containing protein n=1 Tax=Pseudomonas putida TaxID=303 RepID=A0A7W2QI33_PSEPU|nr:MULTISPECIES: hypothetical protein [Pseudomonas]MBA6115301.1 hypothetical protein [Pseudomonas putida]MBI6939915.1 hypothetical protein [Pseudomonas putida]MBI6956115.1 hypothetical protein [Pseudomonas putida]MCZ9639483.1 hypothetical protein [Pseudomonas putida]MEC4878114.1 hypothetical protein [Pseudomonas sp. NC26]
MIRLLRLFTVLLLAIALPLSGMAGVDSPIEPCPMQAQGMAMMAGMQHDCCQDEDSGKSSSHHHTKACKPGQECKTASTLQVSPGNPVLAFVTPRPSDTYAHSLLSRAPPDRWRPPRT